MKTFAVFGNPITHSLSPAIHQQFADQFDLEMIYEKICPPADEFDRYINAFRQKGGVGANVTLPFKQVAFIYAKQLTKRAELAGAVNTLCFEDNTCLGDNTDGIGLTRDLKRCDITLKNKHILILGAGGAARGIIGALQAEDPANIMIYNRHSEKAKALANQLSCSVYTKKIKTAQPIDLLINTTSATFQNNPVFRSMPNLSNTTCYDLNYGERHQTFLAWSKTLNASTCHNGLGMLIEQAAESFYLWTGKRPVTNIALPRDIP